MYTKKRIKSLLGLLAFGRPKYDSVQNMIIEYSNTWMALWTKYF